MRGSKYATFNQCGFTNVSHSEQDVVSNIADSKQLSNDDTAIVSLTNANQSHMGLQQGSGNSIVVTQSNY